MHDAGGYREDTIPDEGVLAGTVCVTGCRLCLLLSALSDCPDPCPSGLDSTQKYNGESKVRVWGGGDFVQ